MISTLCPNCGQRAELDEPLSGSLVKCTRCGKPFSMAGDAGAESKVTKRPQQPAEGLFASRAETQPPAGARPDNRMETVALSTSGGATDTLTFHFLAPSQSSDELGWLGEYRVLRLLGKGGMGLVFEAEDVQLQRRVALKVMRPELATVQASRQRFTREARATAAVRSDHIVTIYQVGEHQEIPYLAMEFLQGQPLDDWLTREPRPSLDRMLSIAVQIARGLDGAHERGLIHRDIKPANIWIEARTARVKILDFGLARPTRDDTHLTQTGMIMGTPAYMAPEQADGESVDARSDLFSFGCVLYQLLTGQTPFSGSSTMAVLKAILMKDPRPPLELNPAMPAALAALVTQLLDKKPENRPPSAAAVVEALEAILANPAVSPPPGKSGPIKQATRSGLTHPVTIPVEAAPPTSRSSKLVLIGGGVIALAGVVVLAIVLSRTLFPPAHEDGKGTAPQEQDQPAPARLATAPGVTPDEIFLGMSADFNGPSKELGRQMKLGLETYFRDCNERGGINGRQVRLVALDDGYDPERALANVQKLNEQEKVFAIIGNVGTPTTKKALPYALENKLPFLGAFTGARLLRNEPPDRYVFNYRASYAEETAATVRYLVENQKHKVRPEHVAVFAQQDAFGDDGFAGVVHAMRKYNRDQDSILRVGYDRNSNDVRLAVETILKNKDIQAIIMVATYKPAARFIQKLKDAHFTGIFTNVSFVGSEALAEELRELGPNYAAGVIVTQVVPPIDSHATEVQKYRELLQKYSKSEQPSFVSLEGYLVAAIFAEGMRRAGDNLTRDRLVDALQSIHNLDLGIGALGFAPSEHQASHKVWGTVLEASGSSARYRVFDLD